MELSIEFASHTTMCTNETIRAHGHCHDVSIMLPLQMRQQDVKLLTLLVIPFIPELHGNQ